MISNNLVSSNVIIAKVISDLNIQEDKIRITDFRSWIGEAMEKIGAVQQLEHKCCTLPIECGQVKLPCDLYRLDQVAVSTCNGFGWLPARKSNSSFDCFFNKCEDKPEMIIQDQALIILTKNLFNLVDDKEALDILNEDNNIRRTLSTLVNQYTINSVNGKIYNNPLLPGWSLQYAIKPGYINLNIPNGFVKLSYHGIYTDEDGMPMIPDEPTYQEAIYWYIVMKYAYPEYFAGRMRQDIYYNAKNSWNTYRKAAYGEAMMPGVDEMRSIQNNWNQLLPELDDHESFFNNLGNPQIIYNHR